MNIEQPGQGRGNRQLVEVLGNDGLVQVALCVGVAGRDEEATGHAASRSWWSSKAREVTS